MSASLEQNPGLVSALRDRAEIASSQEQTALAALLMMAAEALEHTHDIATAGWLETEESEP